MKFFLFLSFACLMLAQSKTTPLPKVTATNQLNPSNLPTGELPGNLEDGFKNLGDFVTKLLSNTSSTGTSLDLFKCVGLNEAQQCIKDNSACDLNDQACQCKHLNKMFDACFPNSKLNPNDAKCGKDILKIRDDTLKNETEQCKEQNLPTDSKNNGGSFLMPSSVLLAMIALLLV